MVAQTCWVFIAARVLYVVCYVADKATLRSIVWVVGLGAVIRLYLLAI
ncbi:MAG: MAPEG family protein [Burkholderiaceae bacterium]